VALTVERAALAVVLLVFCTCRVVDAAALALDERQTQEAIRVGQRSITSEVFDSEWRVANTAGDSVLVYTPFHRIALAARHSAFKNQVLKPTEPERILKDQADRLLLWAYLKGTREDFARHYVPRLLLGEREIEAAFVQNERSAVRDDSGQYVARCVYGFPIKELTGTSRVVLAVRDAEGKDVSRFTIDLASMR
jgi:hypothetical protein